MNTREFVENVGRIGGNHETINNGSVGALLNSLKHLLIAKGVFTEKELQELFELELDKKFKTIENVLKQSLNSPLPDTPRHQ